MNGPLLQVERLSIGYSQDTQQVAVLHDVSLSIHAGETVGLVGESGCGKSTLALALLGFLRSGNRVLAGHIFFDGTDLFSLSPLGLQAVRGRRIALIPQNAGQSLTPNLRIGTQMVETLRVLRGLGGLQARSESMNLLQQVHLPQPDLLMQRYPHQLSGGQQQRVSIALALAGEPQVLVLDEPTTGLDVTTQKNLLNLLSEIRSQSVTAMLFVSHDLGVIAHMSDRVAVMYAGEIVEDSPTKQLLRRQHHPYTRRLIAAIPRFSSAKLPQPLAGQPPAPGERKAGCAFAPRCAFADEQCHHVNPQLESVAGDNGAGASVRCLRWRVVALAEPQTFPDEVGDNAVASLSSEVLLRLQGVKVTYAQKGLGQYVQFLRNRPEQPIAVSDINLTLQRGETLALVGESGSGKSTIVRAIAGLIRPSAGHIAFRDFDLGLPVEQRSIALCQKIQLIFQNPDSSLNPRQTIGQILSQPYRLYFGLHAAEALDRVAALLSKVRLTPKYLARYPNQLSGGEKQRVAIARAFAAEPEIILCDEITSALDVSVQAAILELLAELKAEHHVSCIFISHDLAVVRAIADRVAVLYQGRLCDVGTVQEVYSPPYHPYTESLLASALDPVVETQNSLSPGKQSLKVAT